MPSEKKMYIGEVVRNERQRLGISLDEASRKTGVSKAMLGQVERNESNPTLSTVWKISAGLRIPMSTLLAQKKSTSYHVTRLADIEAVSEEKSGISVYNIFPFDPISAFDYLYITMEPQSYYASTGHPNALEEYLVVTSGSLTLHLAGKTYLLHSGDSLTFLGHEEHAYENASNERTVYQSMIRY